MAINIKRVVLGGLVAGIIRLVFKVVMGRLYLDALLAEDISRLNPALMANFSSASGLAGFVTITVLLGMPMMYMYAAMRSSFRTRAAAVIGASLAAWAIGYLNWSLTALAGIYTWWHVSVESMIMLASTLVGVYAGSVIYADAGALVRTDRLPAPS